MPERLLLRDVPAGLRAVPAPGGLRRDRRRHLRVLTADLIADVESPEEPVLASSDLTWVLATRTRRWPSVEARFGDRAWETGVQLARGGAVTIRCRVSDAVRLGSPIAWQLTTTWTHRRDQLLLGRSGVAGSWQARAQAAALAVEELDPGLAAALRSGRGGEPRLPVLVHAAEDLATGTHHNGPRAFSQAHFRHTKARNDIDETLVAAGASYNTVIALGVHRSPYIGLGGPLQIGMLNLTDFRGPIQFRADDPLLQHAKPQSNAGALVILENLQAAESVCDAHPSVLVAYTAGQPARLSLDLIAALARSVRTVIVVPDADLGGCRIAARVLDALPHPDRAVLVDVGAQPHALGVEFGPSSTAGLQAISAGSDAVASLATACLARGYAVEQEGSTCDAVDEILGKHDLGSKPKVG